MNFPNYFKSWQGIQLENHWGRIITAGLIAVVLLLTVLLFRKETIVTVMPWTLTEEAWVSVNDGSRSYKEAWAFALAQLLGNANPTTAGFIKERLEPLLHPSVYHEVITALDMQVHEIRQERVSMRFEPRTVEYEASTDKTFVYGYSFISGMTTAEKRTERTYEFKIDIANYAPSIRFISTYEGRPQTERALKQLERRDDKGRNR